MTDIVERGRELLAAAKREAKIFDGRISVRNAGELIALVDRLLDVAEAAEELYDVTQSDRRMHMTEKEFSDLEEKVGDDMAQALDRLNAE